MCVPIQRVHRDIRGVVTHVGGFSPNGIAWGLTIAEAVALAEAWQYSWFVEEPAGHRVEAYVATSSAGHKYLTTSPDGQSANNLDSLPNMPNPLSSVSPPFPLSLPGDVTCMLMSIDSVSYASNQALHPLSTTQIQHPPGVVPGPSPVFSPPATFWHSADPHWIYLDTTMPYPAYYDVEVLVVHGTTAALRSMEWVSGSDIAGRRAIEAAGHGWWSWDPVLTLPDGTPDPTLPARLTPVRIVVRLGTDTWNFPWDVSIVLISRTANPYCRAGSGGAVAFRLARPATQPQQPPPNPQVTVPNVVGLTLDVASRQLWALHLNVTTPFSPVAPANQITVVSQTPQAGAMVNQRSGVSLGTVLATQPSGPSQLILHNNSNRSNPLDIWLYDIGGGAWQKKATIDFGDQDSIDLDEQHIYQVAAVDTTLNNCHAGDPSDISCVYWTLQNAVVGGTDPAVDLWIN